MNSQCKNLLTTIFLILIVCVSPATASTPEPPQTPRDFVTDLAGIIEPAAQERLNAVLRELEEKTSSQVLVLTVQSLDGQPLEEFSLNTKEKWKLGQKGKDNGVLIVVSLKDRQYRIEVGYGLEGALPDSLVGSIGREYIVPYFRKGDYSNGIYAATLAIVSTIAEHDGVQLSNGTGPPMMTRGAYSGKRIGPFQMIVLGIFGVIALILFITHPGQCFLIILASQIGGGRGGWSGGGGGGFSGGSFGGGGGGSGGGGGASGGW